MTVGEGHAASDTLVETRHRIDATMGGLPLVDGVEATETDAGGVPAIRCTPDSGATSPLVVYFHGGGYRMGSARAWRCYCSHLAALSGATVLVVDYRLAPEHPFPAAVDDALAAYRFALSGAPAESVVVAGDSAGGGLAAALVLAARDAGLPRPAGLMCCSAWVDLRNNAPSYESRADVDALFSKASADEAAALYLQGAAADDPLASPALGDWTGAPPTLVQVGDAEVLLDDSARLAAGLRAGAASVEHRVFDGMAHVFQLSYPSTPESVAAVERMAAFIHRVSGDHPSVW
jgi:monoterpene epsilon-lactone hydrolase